MSEVWNNVGVFGPAEIIAEFKDLCLFPKDLTVTNAQFGWEGCHCVILVPSDDEKDKAGFKRFIDVENFQHFHPNSPNEYHFSFDTEAQFPEEIFRQLAFSFPALTFDCGCIEAMDKFMGYGFFNIPAGGKGFSQHYRVPKNHWTSGSGYKRTRSEQAKHEACLRWLISCARAPINRVRRENKSRPAYDVER